MSSFSEDMERYEALWEESQAQEATGGMLADGDYQARILEARVEKSDWDEWQLLIKYQDIESGRSIRSWDSLEQDVGLNIAGQRAKMLGYEGPISGLEAACESEMFIDLVVDIRVKTKKGDTRDFTSVYVNRCYGKDAEAGSRVPAGAADDPAAPPDDSDIPF